MTDKAFEAWAQTILGDNPTWRESADCELARQAWNEALRTTVFTDNTQTVVNAEREIERLTLEKKAVAMTYSNALDLALSRIKELEVDLENERRKVTELVEGYEKDAATIKKLGAEVERLKESAILWNKRYQDACQDRIALRQKYGHEIEALESQLELSGKVSKKLAEHFLASGAAPKEPT